ncbi:MAG: hypothetical protein WC319_10955 [Candidatus Paceibacterota bacterium]|jgi:hypothetical protein
MEFDKSITKVIGLLEKEIPDKKNEDVLSAKIKVCGLINSDNSVIKPSSEELKLLFPPLGYVFEYRFFKNYPSFKLGELLEFWTDENHYAKESQDKIKIRNHNPDLKHFGIIDAREIIGFKINGFATNLNTISLYDETDGDFYGITDKYFVGKLRCKNGKIEPALHRRIQIWDLEDDNLIGVDRKYRLIKKPQGESIILDCMDEKQLFEWFRDLLKQIQPDYVDLLDKNRSWRTELPILFSVTDKEKLEADKIRLKRIEEKFDLLELSRNDIKTLVDSSENLKVVFKKCLNNHKDEFKEIYVDELSQYKSEIEQQKKELDAEIERIQSQKKAEESSLAKLASQVIEAETKLAKIKENKNRIIQDFSIIKEVLQGQNQCNNLIQENQNSFVVEEIIEGKNDTIRTIEEFEEQLKYRLSKNAINPQFSTKITNTISTQKAILVKDIKIGLSIVEATNNAKYIIQQVEPDWLHFKDFWNNGLCEIWNSAHNSPDKFHFLLLEDINMSALECYCRPLLDILTGVRKRIPYGQTPYPNNLKIIATIASFEEPEIGLPIYRNTFENWGAIGFCFDINGETKLLPKPESRILTVDFLNNRNIDEFDRINILNDNKTELDSIFEA